MSERLLWLTAAKKVVATHWKTHHSLHYKTFCTRGFTVCVHGADVMYVHLPALLHIRHIVIPTYMAICLLKCKKKSLITSYKNMKVTVLHQSFSLPQAYISIGLSDQGLVPHLLTVALFLAVNGDVINSNVSDMDSV